MVQTWKAAVPSRQSREPRQASMDVRAHRPIGVMVRNDSRRGLFFVERASPPSHNMNIADTAVPGLNAYIFSFRDSRCSNTTCLGAHVW